MNNTKLRVLWFSNTPANADEYFNQELKGTGGWLKALDIDLQDKVELHVAFYWPDKLTFQYKNTTYHTIYLNQNPVKKFLRNRLNITNPEKELSSFLEVINKVKPDIIHIHGTENSFGLIIPHTNLPVVISVQGIIKPSLNKFFSGFEWRDIAYSKRKLSSLKEFFFPYSFKKNYQTFKIKRDIEEKIMSSCKFLIGRTAWDKRVTRVLAPESQYFHVDEILRNSFYNSVWKPHDREKIIIHTTTGNSIYKGFETLCLAINELCRLNINFEWRVAGIKEDDLIVALTKQKLRKNFPEKGLILLGNLNEKSLVEAMLNADIFVMPSHIENSPNSLCEAMILGMPCIATFAGGTGSMLKDGEEGILLQDGDPWAMAGAILELVNDPDKATRMGKNARKRALERHDKAKIITDLINIYNQIINDNQNN